MKKDSVIVVYIPDLQHYIEQFYGLWYSMVGKTDLYRNFDILVTGPSSIEDHIPKHHCRFVAIPELSSQPEFRYRYSGKGYVFVNSFAPFIHPRCIEIIGRYKYCLRLDADTFVCPGLHSIQCADDEILVGMGWYSGKTVRPQLAEILKSRNLPDQNIQNIGTTWFATSPTMIEAGAKTIEYVKYLLEYHFSESIGCIPTTQEPTWSGVVCTMYGGHLVLNSSALKITKTDKLDFPSNWDKEVTDRYTLHCWEGATDFYSKRDYINGKYAGRKPDHSSLKCSEYSYACISRGASHGVVLASVRAHKMGHRSTP